MDPHLLLQLLNLKLQLCLCELCRHVRRRGLVSAVTLADAEVNHVLTPVDVRQAVDALHQHPEGRAVARDGAEQAHQLALLELTSHDAKSGMDVELVVLNRELNRCELHETPDRLLDQRV